jgi:hypothetical protein
MSVGTIRAPQGQSKFDNEPRGSRKVTDRTACTDRVMNDEDEDRALRAHIHDLSFDYALTHLTRDYIPYTEALVAGVRAHL